MHDLGYVAAGYAVTAAALVGYRWRLAVRLRRAHRLVSALTGRAVRREPRP
jgi:hypothetical protein